MLLQELLKDIDGRFSGGALPSRSIGKITSDSRQVEAGDIFVAIKGPQNDGHSYLRDAFEKNPLLLIAETGRWQASGYNGPVFSVSDSKLVYQKILLKFHQNTLSKLKLIGITGTNGKTTSAFLIRHALNQASSCGMIGTVEHVWGAHRVKAKNTTPGLEEFLDLLSRMTTDGMRYCVSEVSSHALDQGRVSGLKFDAALFTNLTQDHLDYHKDFDHYFAAKRKLFLSNPRPAVSVINTDDPYGKKLFSELGADARISFGLGNQSDIQIQHIEAGLSGSRFDLLSQGRRYSIVSPLPLMHNIYNVTGILIVLNALGYPYDQTVEWVSNFSGVPGRMQAVRAGQSFDVFIDYAHTPDAIQNVLSFIKPHVKRNLICVFGCGGNRDRLKRPIMGRIAAQFSDRIILTNDNPRNEAPELILNDILSGIRKEQLFLVSKVPDRAQAIQEALIGASSGDAILILGKGHETEQIIGQEALHFSDYEVAYDCLRHAVESSQ